MTRYHRAKDAVTLIWNFHQNKRTLTVDNTVPQHERKVRFGVPSDARYYHAVWLAFIHPAFLINARPPATLAGELLRNCLCSVRPSFTRHALFMDGIIPAFCWVQSTGSVSLNLHIHLNVTTSRYYFLQFGGTNSIGRVTPGSPLTGADNQMRALYLNINPDVWHTAANDSQAQSLVDQIDFIVVI